MPGLEEYLQTRLLNKTLVPRACCGFFFSFSEGLSCSPSHQACSCSMLSKSPCDVVAREVVHNGQPAFPTACSAGKPPKQKGRGSSRQPPFLPTGISKKDWACLSTREISCPLIHGSTGGMNRPSGPASPCWQGSVGDFIPTFISCVKLYSCLC